MVLRRQWSLKRRQMFYVMLIILVLCSPQAAHAKGASGWVNVLNWKCAGDGNHDDSTCFQNAVDHLAYGGTLYIPAHRANGMQAVYKITQTIHLTNRIAIRILGDSTADQFSGNNYWGSVISAETGSAVLFDAVGLNFLTIEQIDIVGVGANATTLAIQQARSSATCCQYAQHTHLNRVTINLPHIPNANGMRSSIAIFNYGAEIWSAVHVNLVADNPVLFSNYNDLNITSNVQIVAPPQSMSGVSFLGRSSLVVNPGGGPAIHLGGTDFGSLSLGDSFIAANGAPAVPYAIVADANLRGLNYQSGNIEGFNQELKLNGWMINAHLKNSIEGVSSVAIIDEAGPSSIIRESDLRIQNSCRAKFRIAIT